MENGRTDNKMVDNFFFIKKDLLVLKITDFSVFFLVSTFYIRFSKHIIGIIRKYAKMSHKLETLEFK